MSARILEAAAVRFALEGDVGKAGFHPNRVPFKAVLHQVDVKSTRPPNGSGGKLVLVPRLAAEKRLSTLIGMGVNVDAQLGKHAKKNKVGIIYAASIGADPDPATKVRGLGPIAPNDVLIAGWLYAKDFPEEVAAIKAASARQILGTSYELDRVSVLDEGAPFWTLDDFIYTGAAMLFRDSAAYGNTQLAASAAPKRRGFRLIHRSLAAEGHKEPDADDRFPEFTDADEDNETPPTEVTDAAASCHCGGRCKGCRDIAAAIASEVAARLSE